MSGHTAGPWIWVEDCGCWFLVPKAKHDKDPESSSLECVIDEGSAWGEYRAVIEHDSPDAVLIASAPTLLSTLELVKRRLNTCLCDEVEMGESTMNRLFEEVSEAISLAKGEKE